MSLPLMFALPAELVRQHRSAGNFTDMNLRRIDTMVKRGYISEIKKEISQCMLCGKCSLACPRGVNTRNVIMKINQALELYSL